MAWNANSSSANGLRARFQGLNFQENKSQHEAESIEPQALADLKKAQEFLKSLDKETQELLEQECCTLKETAQFWKYSASEPCTDICEIADNPPYKWGGWWRASYMKLYVRTLLEVIKRVERQEDQLLLEPKQSKETILSILKHELKIAILTFQSALETDTVSRTHQDMLYKKAAYDKAKKQAEMNHAALAQVQKTLMGTHVEVLTRKQEYTSTLQEYRVISNQLKELSKKWIDLSQALQDNPHWGVNTGFVQHWHDTLGDFPEGGKEKLEQQQQKLFSLVAAHHTDLVSAENHMYSLEQEKKTFKDQESTLKHDLLALKQEYDKSALYFETLQNRCFQNLFNRVSTLKPGENYCHAAGFIGHAIYLDFQQCNDGMQVKIGNLGPAGTPHRHHGSQHTPRSKLPYLIFFDKTTDSHERLKQFCLSITRAITLTEEQAVKILYDHNLGRKINTAQYEELTKNEILTTELLQEIANCTAKGFMHLLRERMRDYRRTEVLESQKTDGHALDFYYRRLLLSLCVWSKNAFNIRKFSNTGSPHNLPAGIDSLLPEKTIQFMQKSEAVVTLHKKEEIWKLLQTTVSGLSFRPKTVPQNTQLVAPLLYNIQSPPASHRAPLTSSENTVNTLNNSLVNRPELSEDTLADLLHGSEFSPQSGARQSFRTSRKR